MVQEKHAPPHAAVHVFVMFRVTGLGEGGYPHA
ncbi:hypothetical protein DFP97_1555 [Paenibacillus prosopidis]|uniref:Uncharacterized protein n=1 Tax=Paenibacillus prosopidis TaxID=630520 RepID=A0A368VHC6_9BACL|nr:hypothetical protein DFP97_1555 [Paenibacillus prosopidis]